MAHKKQKPLFRYGWALVALCIGFGCYFGILAARRLRQTTFPVGDSAAMAGQSLQLYCIDVGQGEALLIRQGEQWALLDSGPPDAADTVLAFLRANGVRELEYFICSHLHSDHIGGAAPLLHRITVRHLLLPCTAAAPANELAAQMTEAIRQQPQMACIYAATGDTFSLGSAVLRVLHDGAGEESDNESCLVLQLQFGGFTALAAGDSGTATEALLLQRYPGLRADLFKVSHHGSNSSNSEEFLRALRPKAALICCAAQNDYGHPHAAVLERLAQTGAKIFRTDVNGTVSVDIRNGQMTLQTQR